MYVATHRFSVVALYIDEMATICMDSSSMTKMAINELSRRSHQIPKEIPGDTLVWENTKVDIVRNHRARGDN